MRILGLDPGLSGALALLDGQELCGVFDFPTVEVAHGKKTRDEISPALLHEMIVALTPVDFAVVEEVTASPQMGTVSAFRFGESFGVLCAVLAACGIRVHFVRPAKWKKVMGLNSEAEVSRAMALDLWPDQSVFFKRKMDHNRAEAALLAEFGRKHLT